MRNLRMGRECLERALARVSHSLFNKHGLFGIGRSFFIQGKPLPCLQRQCPPGATSSRVALKSDGMFRLLKRPIARFALATAFLLVACNRATQPNSVNFTVAINQYLAKHGDVCTVSGDDFPLDVPRSGPGDPKMDALTEAGLVSESDVTAVVHGMLDSLRGPTPPQPVRRYQLTADGQKYFSRFASGAGQTGGFCYGQKTVDTILDWSQPESGSSRAEVTYTYRIVNLASWARRSDVQQEFPDIRSTIYGASKAKQVVGIELTNAGWQVPNS